MASTKEKQTIRKMADQGKSVNQIQKQTQLPKSTVYYHFRKEVGQKQKQNQPKIPEDPEFKGELCGTFAGDGNFYHEKQNHKYRIVFTLNIKDDYWKKLRELLTEKLGKEPHTFKQPESNRVRLRYESKIIYKFLKKNLDWEKEDKTGTVCLKQKEFSKKFKKGFLRGLIDTDGHLARKQKRLIFNTISQPLSKSTEKLLSDLGIEYKTYHRVDHRENCRDMYRTNVRGAEARRFLIDISPRHPKKQLNKLFNG